MRVYYPIIDSNTVLVALTQEKTVDSLDVTFAEDYLLRLGITLGSDVRVNIPKGFIVYVYNSATRQIERSEEISIFRSVFNNAARSRCEQSIVSGVTYKGRLYGTDVTDQLSIQQALIIAQVDGTVDIKCTIDGVSQFVAHNATECSELYYTLSTYILNQRKQLLATRTAINSATNADQLSLIKMG